MWSLNRNFWITSIPFYWFDRDPYVVTSQIRESKNKFQHNILTYYSTYWILTRVLYFPRILMGGGVNTSYPESTTCTTYQCKLKSKSQSLAVTRIPWKMSEKQPPLPLSSLTTRRRRALGEVSLPPNPYSWWYPPNK